jgi:hypothetical protein
MPTFIHETEKVLEKWQASGGHTQSGTANGE